MKRFLWVLVLLLVGVLAFIYFFSRNNLKGSENTALVYNHTTGQWDTVKNLPRVDIEDVEENLNEDGLHNRTLLRGYFDHYDVDNNELTIKAALPFTGNLQYQLTKLKMPLTQAIFCSPSIIIDQVTGETLRTQELTFMVKNDEVMTIYQEKVVDFDQFIEQSKQDTYLFIQLTDNFAKNKTNYIKKLVVIGLCD